MNLPQYKSEWEDQLGNKLLLDARSDGKLYGSYTSIHSHGKSSPIRGFWDSKKPYPTMAWVIQPPAPLKVKCYGLREHWIVTTKSWALKIMKPTEDKSHPIQLHGSWLEVKSRDEASTKDDLTLTGCSLFTYTGVECS